MARKILEICPPDCQDKHSTTRIMMARIEEKQDNLIAEVSELKEFVKEAMESKADKSQVKDLYQKYWIAVAGVVSLLLTIIFLLIEHSFK